MLTYLVFSIVLGIATAQMKTTCPTKEGIRRCSCKIDIDRLPWLSCSGFQSLTELQTASIYMKGYLFANIFIDSSDLGRLPSDIFSGMEIRSLKISFSNITALGDGINRPPFVGLEHSIEDIEIRDVFIDDSRPMPTISLSHLKKLELLELTNNVIPVIGNDWFQSGPYTLKDLHFSTSSTKKLGSHAFAMLLNLKKLSVTGGTISELRRSMLPSSAHYLSSIDFSYNALTSLPADIFKGMPSLSEVYLDNNAFTEISEVEWSAVWNQMTHVFYYGNPISCDEKIKWIYKYRLPEVLGGKCVSPDHLKDRELGKLTIKNFP